MIELLCTDYNKKATSIHYYFGNAVLGKPKLSIARAIIFLPVLSIHTAMEVVVRISWTEPYKIFSLLLGHI